MKYNNSTSGFAVQSTKYETIYVGNNSVYLYCKLISPARVMEWILNDGLHKNFYWIHNNITDDTNIDVAGVQVNEVNVEDVFDLEFIE